MSSYLSHRRKGFQGGVTAFDGFGNRSRSFNGVDDYISIPDINESTTNLSVALWVKTTDQDWVTTHLAHWRTLSNNRAWWIGPSRTAETNGKKLMVYLSGDGDGADPVKRYYGTTDVSDGTWHHVAFTWDNGTLKLFVDGSEETTTKVFDHAMTTIYNSDGPITVGCTWVNDAPANLGSGGKADVRIYNSTLTATDISDIYNGTNITTNLVGHWLTDADNLLDNAGSNNGTNYGSKYSYDNTSPPVEFGSASRDFNGTSDYISIPDINESTTNLSAALWVKTTQSGADKLFFSHWDVGGATRAWTMTNGANGQFRVAIAATGDSATRKIYYTNGLYINDGSWHHVAFTFSNNNLKLFVNGVEDANIVKQEDSTVNSIFNSSANLSIGGALNSGNLIYPSACKLSDCRIYDTDLTASQVSDLYAGTDVRTNLVGHWLTDNDDVEDKAGTNDGTNFGSTYSYDNPPMDLVPSRQASRDFSGVSQHVEMSDVVSIGTGSLSWSCWLNADSIVNTRGIVRMGRASSSGNARYDGLQILLVNSKISGYLIDYNNSGNVFAIQSSSNVVVGKWHHAVVSLDANAKTLELFADGVSEGSVSLSSIHPWDITAQDPPSIGAREIADGNFTADEFNGRIADVRLYDSALTLTEVLDIYNGTTDRTNLIGQWLTNSDDVLDHAGTNDGTNNGSTYSTDSPS